MSFTVTELTELRDDAKAAYLIALKGQSYGVSTAGTNRSFTRQQVNQLRLELENWDRKLDQANSGTGMKVRYGLPLNTRRLIRTVTELP